MDAPGEIGVENANEVAIIEEYVSWRSSILRKGAGKCPFVPNCIPSG
jgi:hypothetical protein